jgi:hypothetical protein
VHVGKEDMSMHTLKKKSSSVIKMASTALFPADSVLFILKNMLKIETVLIHCQYRLSLSLGGRIQKFPDWPPGARTANGTALCH